MIFKGFLYLVGWYANTQSFGYLNFLATLFSQKIVLLHYKQN